MTRVIGVASGKGGVGKTTVVSNLGVSLAQEGANVAILDANLTGANLGFHFGFIAYPTSLHQVIRGEAVITDAMYKHVSGVEVIPASLSVDDLETKPKNLKQIFCDHLSDKDFILIDCATGLDQETIVAIEMSDEILLVTHPELPTISDTLRTKELSKKLGKDVLGVVLNRVSKQDRLKKENIVSFFDLPIISVIPEDHRIRRSIEVKKPVVLQHPRSIVGQEFKRLSYHLLDKEFTPSPTIFERLRYVLNG